MKNMAMPALLLAAVLMQTDNPFRDTMCLHHLHHLRLEGLWAPAGQLPRAAGQLLDEPQWAGLGTAPGTPAHFIVWPRPPVQAA
jgi:hypothetical protein